MKRHIFYPAIVVLTAMLLLVNLRGCTDDVVRHHVDDTPDFSVTSTSGDLTLRVGEVILYAGQHIKVGTVKVTNDKDHLFVSYHIQGGWCMMETHVHVGLNLKDFPLVGRWQTPAPGQFDYSNDHECVTEYTYTIDLGDWQAGQELFIAAHAVVQKGDVTETAWAAGIRFSTNQGNWATYFMHTVVYTCGDPIIDIDGNVYQTVQIGEQCWMATNLKVTKYRDGTPIPQPTSTPEFYQFHTGAYAVYDHSLIEDLNSEAEVIDAYGLMYNWFAVDEDAGLCPEGWHVPSDVEWTALVNYIVEQGYPNTNVGVGGAGHALRSRRQVNSPLGEPWATNEHPRWNFPVLPHHGLDVFGFSALPGGIRTMGGFQGIGFTGRWWSSDRVSPSYAQAYYLEAHTGRIHDSPLPVRHGRSVRCLMDN